jgi:hypothetical protein
MKICQDVIGGGIAGIRDLGNTEIIYDVSLRKKYYLRSKHGWQHLRVCPTRGQIHSIKTF